MLFQNFMQTPLKIFQIANCHRRNERQDGRGVYVWQSYIKLLEKGRQTTPYFYKANTVQLLRTLHSQKSSRKSM